MAFDGEGSGRPARAAALATLAVAGSYVAVRSGRSDPVDAAAERLAVRRGPRQVDRAVSVSTDLGSVYGLIGVVGVLVGTGRRRLASQVGVAGLLAWTGAQAAKPLLHRPRPYELGTSPRLVAPPAGSSWPSGHAAVVASMSASVLSELPRRHRPVVVALTAAVGMSRLRVGVHHLTDVVAGFGVGALSATAARSLLRRFVRTS